MHLGGYYIDVGASQLIIDGKIKVKQGVEITAVKPHGLLFADGTELPADEIIFATGYENMRGTARKIFGDELAESVKVSWILPLSVAHELPAKIFCRMSGDSTRRVK